MEPKEFDNDRIKHYERLEDKDSFARELSEDVFLLLLLKPRTVLPVDLT